MILWIFAAVSGCHDVRTYGIGSPCSTESPCRNPLVCRDGRCALKEGIGGNTSSSRSSKPEPNAQAGAFIEAGRGGVGGETPGLAGTTSGVVGRASAPATELTTGGATAGAAGTGAAELSRGGTSAELTTGGATAGAAGTGAAELSRGGTSADGGSAAASAAGISAVGTSQSSSSNGTSCKSGSECSSRYCVDGVCCVSACTEECKACNIPGSEGSCSIFIGEAPLAPRPPCRTDKTICGRQCTGAASCSYPDDKTMCDGTSRCLTTVTRLNEKYCDRSGNCTSAVTTDCWPQFCNSNTDGKCGKLVYTQVDVAQYNSCAVLSNGSLKCWGTNIYTGQMGLPAQQMYPDPTTLDYPDQVKLMTAGWGHTCTILHDGRVICFGAVTNGDIGCVDWKTVVSNTCTPFPADANVDSIVAGGEQTCAVLKTGKVKCWGRGDKGEIGDGFINHRFSPTLVVGVDNAIGVVAGAWQSCAILADGTAKCWGDNSRGLLGIGEIGITYPNAMPVAGIDGITSKVIAGAGSHQNTCFLMADHSIRCSGSNSNGQLGVGQSDDAYIPVPVQPPLTATAIALGSDFVCAIVAPRSVKCWGKGHWGTLGNGEFVDSNSPVDVLLPLEITEVKSIAAKADHACILDGLGQVWCWGDNRFGQLGDGTTYISSVPVKAGPP